MFIFISLRALRFEALYLILAGAAAAIGWSGMVAYAVMWDDGGMMVTRDYIYYMTNNAILIGAEFDKIISILMVTIVLAVAIARARRTLEQAVADAAAAEDMSRFLAPEVVAQVTESEARAALVPADMYALSEDQGFQASSPDEHLPARAVEGVAKPIDLVALSA